MKTVWVLNVRTSLPEVLESNRKYKHIREAYESFDAAKARVREILKEFAFSENAMFDGKGYVKYFTRYIDDAAELMEEILKEHEDALAIEFEEDNFADKHLSVGFLNVLHKKLHCIFSGEDTALPFPQKTYDDCKTYLQVDVLNGCIQLEGAYDGPCNGINPYIKTNMFDMTEEKDYMLYIDDYFTEYYSDHPEWTCNYWSSAELYIDLNKIQVK